MVRESGMPVTSEDKSGSSSKVINNSCGTLAALNAVMNIPPQQSAHGDETIAIGVSSCTDITTIR